MLSSTREKLARMITSSPSEKYRVGVELDSTLPRVELNPPYTGINSVLRLKILT